MRLAIWEAVSTRPECAECEELLLSSSVLLLSSRLLPTIA